MRFEEIIKEIEKIPGVESVDVELNQDGYLEGRINLIDDVIEETMVDEE